MGAILFYDSTIPVPQAAVGSAPTRVLIVADEEHVHLQLVTVSGDAIERVIMLTPQAACEIANALSAAAGYVDRSPQTPKAA